MFELRIFLFLLIVEVKKFHRSPNSIIMNELEKNQTRYPWLKQLLISIFGTAIGVGLTFFANNAVEKKHQQAAQRETAIMAVCDIDEIAQGLKEEIHIEDSLFKVAMYVSSHLELIDSFPMDTLVMAFEYLYDNPMTMKGWVADPKENAFNSGIDARLNLGANMLERLNSENRVLMNITSEDIEAYLKSNPDNISEQVLAGLLLGTWEMRMNNYQITYNVHQDNEFEITINPACNYSLISKRNRERYSRFAQ